MSKSEVSRGVTSGVSSGVSSGGFDVLLVFLVFGWPCLLLVFRQNCQNCQKCRKCVTVRSAVVSQWGRQWWHSEGTGTALVTQWGHRDGICVTVVSLRVPQWCLWEVPQWWFFITDKFTTFLRIGSLLRSRMGQLLGNHEKCQNQCFYWNVRNVSKSGILTTFLG